MNARSASCKIGKKQGVPQIMFKFKNQKQEIINIKLYKRQHFKFSEKIRILTR